MEQRLDNLPRDLRTLFEKQAWKDCLGATEAEHEWHLLSRIWDSFKDFGCRESFRTLCPYPSGDSSEDTKPLTVGKSAAPTTAVNKSVIAPNTKASALSISAKATSSSSDENTPAIKKPSGSSQSATKQVSENTPVRSMIQKQSEVIATAKLIPESVVANGLKKRQFKIWNCKMEPLMLDLFENFPFDGTASAFGRILEKIPGIKFHGKSRELKDDVAIFVFYGSQSGIKKLGDLWQLFQKEKGLVSKALHEGHPWPGEDLELIGRHPISTGSTEVQDQVKSPVPRSEIMDTRVDKGSEVKDPVQEEDHGGKSVDETNSEEQKLVAKQTEPWFRVMV